MRVFRSIEEEKATYPIRVLALAGRVCERLNAAGGVGRHPRGARQTSSIHHRRGHRDSGQGELHDGYHYHDAAGVRRYHGELHVHLVERLSGDDS